MPTPITRADGEAVAILALAAGTVVRGGLVGVEELGDAGCVPVLREVVGEVAKPRIRASGVGASCERGHASRDFRRVVDLAPLQILESRGWIRARPGARSTPGGGRPAAPAWDVHPNIVS